MDQDYFNGSDSSDQFADTERSSFVEQIDLQHYLRILRKYKWQITLFTVIVTSLAGYYAYTTTPIYSATSTLLIEEQKSMGLNVEELYGLETQNAEYYQTQFELLKSRTLAIKVIDALGLWNNPELSPAAQKMAIKVAATQNDFDSASPTGIQGWVSNTLDRFRSTVPSTDSVEGNAIVDEAELVDLQPMVVSDDEIAADRDRVVSNFISRRQISPVRKTKLVKISFESADPALAARVANAIGDQYIESYLDAKMEMTKKASDWMGEQLSELKAALDASKDKLLDYKQEHGLVDVGNSVARLNEQQLLLFTTELAQARSELAATNNIYRQIRTLRASPELLETIPGVQADPLVQRVKIEQGQAQRNLDELLNRYGARHPRVVDAQSQLTTLNASLRSHVSRVVASIEKDYQLQRQRVSSIELKLISGKQEIQAIGSKKFELDAFEREVATNQGLYDTFFNRQREASSAEGLERANARISDPAILSNLPIKPKKQLILMLAGLSSLVLSMLMALLYEQMDDTIKGTRDVETKLGVRLLGILPLVTTGRFNKKGRSMPLAPDIAQTQNASFHESVNTARTALCMHENENPRKVILITSSIPGEGKSTASMNLAHSLSQLERVLLIDCDMRKPTIGTAAGYDRGDVGLSNLITSTAPAKQCIKVGAFGGAFDIIPAGPIPDQPLELLASKRFENILEQLSQHYDKIVLDSAPTQAVSDALVLSKYSDAVVYIIKSHSTSIELIKRGLQRLQQSKAKIAGVLVTQVDIAKITSYGGDYYYQGYYDYYGYSEKQGVRKPGKIKLSQDELLDIKTDVSNVQIDLEVAKVRPQSVKGAEVEPFVQSAANGEFDLTAQVEEPLSSKPVRKQRARYATSLDDDLDII